MPTYAFTRVRNGEREWGVASGDTPEQAMTRVLGSHPAGHGVSYANVYLPDVEGNHEWFMHPPTRPQDHKPLR